MATRAFIGRLNDDGTVTAVYAHYDNYPSHTGRILLEKFGSAQDVDQYLFGPQGEEEDAVRSIRMFYEDGGVDWFEEEREPYVLKDLAEFLGECQEDYTYLFKPAEHQWYFRSWSGKLKKLKMADCSDE